MKTPVGVAGCAERCCLWPENGHKAAVVLGIFSFRPLLSLAVAGVAEEAAEAARDVADD